MKRTLLNERVSSLIGRRIPDGPDGYQAALRKLEREGGLDNKLLVELVITLLAMADATMEESTASPS